MGYVYFVRGENGLIKIGFTGSHPAGRLAGLRASSATSITPLGVIRGWFSTERTLHGRFALSRHHSEWFYPTPDLLAFIAKKAKPWPGDDEVDPPMSDEENGEAYRTWFNDLAAWARTGGLPQREWGPILMNPPLTPESFPLPAIPPKPSLLPVAEEPQPQYASAV